MKNLALQTYCAGCHGDNLEKFTANNWMNETGTESVEKSIKYGIVSSGMPAFDGKGYLYFGVGERGQHFDFPQKLDNTNGKIHRIYDDGRIPEDNPFVNTESAIKTIYSYGHRNPQGTAVHPETGEVWETEHGTKRWR